MATPPQELLWNLPLGSASGTSSPGALLAGALLASPPPSGTSSGAFLAGAPPRGEFGRGSQGGVWQGLLREGVWQGLLGRPYGNSSSGALQASLLLGRPSGISSS